MSKKLSAAFTNNLQGCSSLKIGEEYNDMDEDGVSMSEVENLIDERLNGVLDNLENRIKGRAEQFEQRI